MYFLYILYSIHLDRYYVGSSPPQNRVPHAQTDPGILTLTDQDAITTVYEIKKYTPTEMWLYSEDVATNGNSTVVTTQDVRFSR